jgi:hypothetical protein
MSERVQGEAHGLKILEKAKNLISSQAKDFRGSNQELRVDLKKAMEAGR